jgi:Ca-activated chloride channel homolog
MNFSLAAAPLWAAQQSGPPRPGPKPEAPVADSEPIFHAETRVVVCPTTVVDKAGHLVTDLPKSAIQVYENKDPQNFTIKREDVPVSLGLIIDNSGSMRDKRKKVEAAALNPVLASNKDDEAFVVNFNDSAYLDLPHEKEFTSDIEEMKEALARIDSRGGTAMRDAIRMSIEHLRDKAHRENKLLVVVTDGVDNSSIAGLGALVKMAQQSGVSIYAVGLLSEDDRRDAARAKRELESLTEATGGAAFFPKELAEVEHIAEEVARDIRNQYTYTRRFPRLTALSARSRSWSMRLDAPPCGHGVAIMLPRIRPGTRRPALPNNPAIVRCALGWSPSRPPEFSECQNG